MTRFLMTLDQAIDLVLFAISNGKNGQILIPKTSGTTIENMVEALQKIYHYPKSKIITIGTRHGEKMHETLMSAEEKIFSKIYKNYFVVKSDNRELNYDLYFNKGEKKLQEEKSYTSQNTKQLSVQEVIKLIKPYINNLKFDF